MGRLTIGIVLASFLLGPATASAQEAATEFLAVDLEIGWMGEGTKPDPKADAVRIRHMAYQSVNSGSKGSTVGQLSRLSMRLRC